MARGTRVPLLIPGRFHRWWWKCESDLGSVHTGGKPGQWDDGPANDTKLGVHILPLAFPWTLAMIRKVATILGPAALASLIRMALLVYEMQFRMILKIILK